MPYSPDLVKLTPDSSPIAKASETGLRTVMGSIIAGAWKYTKCVDAFLSRLMNTVLVRLSNRMPDIDPMAGLGQHENECLFIVGAGLL